MGREILKTWCPTATLQAGTNRGVSTSLLYSGDRVLVSGVSCERCLVRSIGSGHTDTFACGSALGVLTSSCLPLSTFQAYPLYSTTISFAAGVLSLAD